MSAFELNSGCHESLLRAYPVLRNVQEMLVRGDSAETIREFIVFCGYDEDLRDVADLR